MLPIKPHFPTLLALFLASGVLAAEGPAPAAVGWRQNWTGRFPDATPPTEWGRTLKGSVVKDLLCQVTRPAKSNQTEAASQPIPDGLLMSFIVAGPFDAKERGKGLDEEFIPREADVQPSLGEKAGVQVWKKLTQDRPSYVQWDVMPVAFQKVLGVPKRGQLAYAHAYLYATNGGKATLMLDHTDGCKAWLNGKEVYTAPKASIGFTSWPALSRVKLNFQPPSRSARIAVTLNPGWNRLLLKVAAASDTEWGGGWAVLARFTEAATPSYDDKNILCATKLPETSNAGPLIVGDKVLVVSEPDELICLDKNDGKVLWQRFNDYYEATPRKDRDKSPLFNEIKPLAVQLAIEEDPLKKADVQRQIRDLLLKISPEMYGMNMDDRTATHYGAAGFSTPTPCSDGKYVYVWFTHGVAACYDLQGQRKWIKRIDELAKSPKDKYGPYFYPQGTVLAGNRFILWDKDTFALDTASGDVVWRQPKQTLSIGAQAATMAGTGVVVSAGGVLRLSDGAIAWENRNKGISYAGGTFVDGLYYMPGAVSLTVANFTAVKGDRFVPSMWSGEAATREQHQFKANDYVKAGEWKELNQFSTPLVHEGFVYIVDNEGMLYVMDAKSAKLVYRQQLPLEPLINARAAGVCSPLTLAGKAIYAMDNQGTTVVFEPGKEYNQIAKNRIETFVDRAHAGDGWQECATYGAPVFDGSRLYIRGETHLYCVGEK